MKDFIPLLESIKDLIREVYALKKEKETYRDFIGERGLTEEYKQWLKANMKE